MVGGSGILFLPAADEGAVLHPGHVQRVCAVEIAAGQFLLIELGEDALPHRLGAQGFQLFLASIDPDDRCRAGTGGHFIDPG